MEFRHYVTIVWKWLWLVILGTVLAGGAALVVSLNTTPIYEATATVLVTQSDNPSLTTRADVQTNKWLAVSYAEMMGRPVILRDTAAQLGLARINQGDVSVDPVADTQLVEVRVRNANPQHAADIANTLPSAFTARNEDLQLGRFSESKAALEKELSRLQAEVEATEASIQAIGKPTTAEQEAELARLQAALVQYRASYATVLANYESVRLTEVRSIGSVIIFEEATVPRTPILPRTWPNTLLAAVVGAALALGIAFLIEYLDDTLKNTEDVAAVLGLSTLGTIARLRSGKAAEDKLVTAATPKSPISEAFRTLRTNIQFSSVDKPIRRLLITSASPSEGKSFVGANLAIAMAQAGQSVALIDTDLRRPVQHQLFNFSNQTGVTNSLLSDVSDTGQYLLNLPVENLHLLASGPLPPNPSEMLGSQRMGKLVEYLEQQYGVLVFDSPPVLAVTDAAVLSRQMDGVLLVIKAGDTREKDARRAKEELANVGAPVLGVVLNQVSAGRRHGYYYYRETTQDGTPPASLRWQRWLERFRLSRLIWHRLQGR